MMIKFSVTKESHVTYTIGLVRHEAEALLKIVHAGLGTEAFAGGEKDIGCTFMNVLQKQLTGSSNIREAHE